jgi:hypothetical protein
MTSSPGTDFDLDEEEEDLSALDTLEFAGVLESGEFDAVVAARPRAALEDPEAGAEADSVSDVTAVELLPDTQLEMGVLDPAAVLPPRVDAMPLYEELRGCCVTSFGAVAVQMATRSGRVVVSSIADPDRRRRVAEFSAEAVGSLAHQRLEDQCGLVHVGELHVFVAAVDEIRIFTALFTDPPAVDDLLAAIQPPLQDFRRRRGVR